MSAQKKEMIIIDTGIEIAKSDLIDTFSDKELLEPYLNMIRDAVTVPESEINLNTDKGRKAIGSRAHQVSKIKTALMNAGKDSVSELKAQVAAVNSGVKYIESKLDNLRDSTRQPLTLWQQEQDRIEAERVKAISVNIEGIRALGVVHGVETIEQISSMIEAVDNIDCSEGFEEFTQDAMRTVSEAKNNLSAAMQKLIEKAQQEELQRKIAEERAVNLINERINNLRMIPLDLTGKSSREIDTKINSLTAYQIPAEEFGERFEEAKAAQDIVIKQLNIMCAQAMALEVAEAKVKESELIAAQAEEDQRIAEQAHQAIADQNSVLPEPVQTRQAPCYSNVNAALNDVMSKPIEVKDSIEDSQEFNNIVDHLMIEIELDDFMMAKAIAKDLMLGHFPHVSFKQQQTKAA